MSEKKISGFEIAGLIYSEIYDLESNIHSLKYEKNSIKSRMSNKNFSNPSPELLAKSMVFMNNDLDNIEKYANNILANANILRSAINKIYTRTDVLNMDDNKESTNEII